MCYLCTCSGSGGRDGQLTVEHVAPWGELPPQPDNPAEIVAVERTAQGIHRSGTVALLFPPAGHVGDGPAPVEAEEINFVHGGAGCFYSNNLHALVQIALELESEVNQLQHQIFFRRLIVCADIVHSKRVDGCGLGMTAIPADEDVLPRVHPQPHLDGLAGRC